MSSYRVDYSEIVEALQEGRPDDANELLKELTLRLRDYLEVVLNATEEEAKECTQKSLLIAYEKIMEGKIKNKKQIFSYLIRVCRNEFFGLMKDRWKKETDAIEEIENYERHLVEPGQQIERLQDEDRQHILEACLKNLKKKSREFIEYLIDNPDTSTSEASDHFGMSEANVRTKKSRLLSRLHYCFQRKWNK